MPDIKIKRYADKENLKKLMKYSKDTFVNKSEINEKFYTKEQIDTMLGGSSGGTVDLTNYYTKTEVDTKLTSKVNTSDLSNYYTKPEVNNLLSNSSVDSITNEEIDEICVL